MLNIKNLVITVTLCLVAMLLIACFIGAGVATQLQSSHAVTGNYSDVNYTYFYCLFVLLSAFISGLIISARHYN